MKYFYIESLGCSKNQVDSETIIRLLSNRGYTFTNDPDRADLIIVNTCGFINPAKQQSIDTTLEFRARYPDKKIIMTGCLSQRYFSELEKEMTEIDGIWGTEYSDAFSTFIEAATGPGNTVTELLDVSNQPKLSFPGSAYIKISEGCINNCTYCAIPLIRGKLKSRPEQEIIDEIREMTELGIQEINLVAQDSASFGTDTGSGTISSLVKNILSINSDIWLRVLYLHPDKFPGELLAIAQSDPRFLPYFDIPFQHGSRDILGKMGRHGNREDYMSLIDEIRNSIPEAVIRTTFLVGFPGETEKDFNTLCEFQNSIKPNWAGVFTYSREEGTKASLMEPHISFEIAENRKTILETQQEEITGKWLDGFIGQHFRVLVEEKVQNEDLLLARTWFQAPEVDGITVVEGSINDPGNRIPVRISGKNGVDFSAVSQTGNIYEGIR